MLETITTYIERHHLLPENGQIIVAVSGGADSLCLLHVLHRLCGPGKRYPAQQLHVAHLNHKLRGDASTQDALAVSQLATQWGIPVTIGEIDVPSLARQEHRSLEDAARTARYRFLRQLAHGQPIAVAHHADDQVETLLLHLLRGGGLTGMIGMEPRQQDIIRPLLEVTHAQTIAYCQQHHIIPVEDASNTDLRFLRNRIRHELLPLLESLNPGIRATLLRNAEVMRVDSEWINAQIDAIWPTIILAEQDTNIKLKLEPFLAMPLSLQRHLLRRVTATLCGGQSPLELRHYILIEQLLQQPATRETRMLDLPHHLRLTYQANEIVFERFQETQRRAGASPAPTLYERDIGRFRVGAGLAPALQLPIPGQIKVPGTPWTATAEILPQELLQKVQQALSHEDWTLVWQLLPSTSHNVYVDAGAVGSLLYVRTRHPGDRIRPLGMAPEKKVQDILVDKHIPRNERSYIPLFFSASHCIWLAGLCLDDRVRLTSSTQHILRLSIVEE